MKIQDDPREEEAELLSSIIHPYEMWCVQKSSQTVFKNKIKISISLQNRILPKDKGSMESNNIYKRQHKV